MQVTLVGLGPGDPGQVTQAARDALAAATYIATAVPKHPMLVGLGKPLHALPDDVATVNRLLSAGDVCCAFAGHPREHALGAALLAQGAAVLVPGLSIVDTLCDTLRVTSQQGLHVFPAEQLRSAATLSLPTATAPDDRAWCEMQGNGLYTSPRSCPFVPTEPLLVWGQASAFDENWLQEYLQQCYPTTAALHHVWLGAEAQVLQRETSALAAWPAAAQPTAFWRALFVPPSSVSEAPSWERLGWVTARLLGPAGCPWDRQQTHQSLRAGLLEETYEVLEALDTDDMPALAEELGDLLLQVVVHSEMARQAGHFSIDDVIDQISTKLVGRHPHVFGSLATDGVGEVLRNWEQIKAQELALKGRQRSSVLDGVPPALPALATAQKLVRKAARATFEWHSEAQVWEKVTEELAELREAAAVGNAQAIAEEFGDLLFVLANLGRWLKLDAETCLREGNAKFQRRFRAVERIAATQGQSLPALSYDEKAALWQQAKRNVG